MAFVKVVITYKLHNFEQIFLYKIYKFDIQKGKKK